LGLFVVATLCVMGLTYRLPPAPPWRRRLVAGGVAATWVVANGILILMYCDAFMPRLFVVLLFVAGAMWVVWLAWIFYWPLAWKVRLGVLLLCLLVAAPFPLLVRTENLTGAARVIFNWRYAPAVDETADDGEDTPPLSEPVTLPPVGPDDYAQFLG